MHGEGPAALGDERMSLGGARRRPARLVSSHAMKTLDRLGAVPASAAPPKVDKSKMVSGEAGRSHMYEIDLVRVVTAICVVGVHATFFTLFLNTTTLGAQLQNGVIDALHFTREVFLSITAFVMVYVYARRPFPVWTFWRKRGLGVLLPYVFWSLVYVWVGVPHNPVQTWLSTAVVDVLTGTASFQLYFILLSIEFYIILPLFLPAILRLGERHPWRLLIASGALQMIMLYVDHNVIETGPFTGTQLGQFINAYQASFLPLYQFYAVLGGVAALHAGRLRPFVQRHGGWVLAASAFGLGALWLRYGIDVWVEHRSDAFDTSVFQPVMVFYAAAVALFLYWLGVRWASGRSPEAPHGQRFMSLLSDASFGIYLIHPLILMPIETGLAPKLPVIIPVAMRVAMVWGLAAGLTAAACIALLHVPLLSRLIGRANSRSLPIPWPRQILGSPPIAGRVLASRRSER